MLLYSTIQLTICPPFPKEPEPETQVTIKDPLHLLPLIRD